MCPKCGKAGAVRVRWTPWGGFLGPLLFQLKHCHGCGLRFGGRSKVPESRASRTYVRVVAPLALVLGVGMVYGLVAWCGW
jgi:hypothetical protein